MSLTFTDTANASTGTAPSPIVTAVIGGITYLYAGAGDSSSISVFRVGADGSLISLGGPVVGPAGISSMTMVTNGVQTLLYVGGYASETVQAYIVGSGGALTLVGGATPMARPNSVTSVVAGGQTYVFASSDFADMVKGFRINFAGELVALGGSTGVSATVVTSAVVGGTPYLFTAGKDTDLVSVFAVAANGVLTPVASVADTATLQLNGAASLTTATVGGATFLFVGGYEDDGISVFRVDTNGALTNVDNVTDSESASLELDIIAGLTTATIDGKVYLFAAGQADDGVSVFAVGASGVLTNVGNIQDAGLRELDGASGVKTAVVGGSTYLFASGLFDNGVSAFRIVDNLGADIYVVDSANDVVNEIGGSGIDLVRASVSFSLADASRAKGQIEKLTLIGNGNINGTGNALDNTIIGNSASNKLRGELGNDLVRGGSGNDLLVGGAGKDKLAGEIGKDALAGDNGDDMLGGGDGKDTLIGGNGKDMLVGGNGADKLTGGMARDVMNGGAGPDIFDFNLSSESVRGTQRDVVSDFSRKQGDLIDLRTIDADRDGTAGNQVFKFIRSAAFSGVDGELRFANGILQGDTNGDKIADFEIKVLGIGMIQVGDMLL